MRRVLTIVSIVCAFVLRIYAQEGAVSESIQIGSLVPDFDINILTKEGTAKKNIKAF